MDDARGLSYHQEVLLLKRLPNLDLCFNQVELLEKVMSRCGWAHKPHLPHANSTTKYTSFQDVLSQEFFSEPEVEPI